MNPCFNQSQDASTCVNLAPGYRCTGCPPGYAGDAPAGVGLEHAMNNTQQCVDIDECSLGLHLCDPNSDCVNTLVRLFIYVI